MADTPAHTRLPAGEELAAYALAFKLLGMAFYQPPSEELLRKLGEDGLLAEWPLQPAAPASTRGRALLLAYLATAEPSALAPALRNDFAELFVGPDHVAAPPWESVYLSREHLLFDVQTLQVRQEYERFGLQIPRVNREPDDHIGFELLFVAQLLDLAAQALEHGQRNEAVHSLTAAHTFLSQHPRMWVGLFAERLDRHASTDFYRGLGQLLVESLDALDDRLNEALPPPGGGA